MTAFQLLFCLHEYFWFSHLSLLYVTAIVLKKKRKEKKRKAQRLKWKQRLPKRSNTAGIKGVCGVPRRPCGWLWDQNSFGRKVFRPVLVFTRNLLPASHSTLYLCRKTSFMFTCAPPPKSICIHNCSGQCPLQALKYTPSLPPHLPTLFAHTVNFYRSVGTREYFPLTWRWAVCTRICKEETITIELIENHYLFINWYCTKTPSTDNCFISQR